MEETRKRVTGRPEQGPDGRYYIQRMEMINHKREVFRWEAQDSDLTISFPIGEDPLCIGTTRIPAGTALERVAGEEFERKFQTQQPYRYSLYHHRSGMYVYMNSDPEIIIDE